jgi:cytochrome c-type biogenesis protein CcmH
MKRFITQVLLLFCFLQMCNDVVAGVAKPLAEDPVIEARLKAMSQELRCLVCQNQTLSDSSAPLAEDLRREIRSQMREGKTDQQVIDYLVARYGDFVRYRPPVNSYTLLLWFGPFFLLLIGGFMLYRMLKKQVGNSEIQAEDL